MKEKESPSPDEIKEAEKRLKKQLAIFFRNEGVQETDRTKTLEWYRYFLSRLKKSAKQGS